MDVWKSINIVKARSSKMKTFKNNLSLKESDGRMKLTLLVCPGNANQSFSVFSGQMVEIGQLLPFVNYVRENKLMHLKLDKVACGGGCKRSWPLLAHAFLSLF